VRGSDISEAGARVTNWSNNHAAAIVADELYWQLWYRDGAGGLSGFNLSDGLHVTSFSDRWCTRRCMRGGGSVGWAGFRPDHQGGMT
jgi:hypothetical protein